MGGVISLCFFLFFFSRNVALKKCRAKEFGTAVACESGRKDRGKKIWVMNSE